MNALETTSGNFQAILPTLLNQFIEPYSNTGTRAVYAGQLQSLIDDKFNLFNFTAIDAVRYTQRKLSENYSKTCLQLRFSVLRRFLNSTMEQAEKDEDKKKIEILLGRLKPKNQLLKEDFENVKIATKRRAFGDDVLPKILHLSKNDRLKKLCLWIDKTGARISELLSLEYYDPAKDTGSGYENYVKQEGDRLYFYLRGKGRNGGKLREFYLKAQTAKPLLKTWGEPGQLVFTNRAGKRLTRFGAYQLLKDFEKKHLADEQLFKFSPHAFRHNMITRSKASGVDSAALAKICGNSILTIQKNYDHAVYEI